MSVVCVLILLSLTRTLAQSECANVDTLCLTEFNLELNKEFDVYFPFNQIPIDSKNFYINLYEGNLSLDQKANLCDESNKLYGQQVYVSNGPQNMYSVKYIIPEDTVGDPTGKVYYLQLIIDDLKCIVGPRTAGNQNTFFNLQKSAESPTTTTVTPTNWDDNGSQSKGNGDKNTARTICTVIAVFIALVSIFIAIWKIFNYWKSRSQPRRPPLEIADPENPKILVSTSNWNSAQTNGAPDHKPLIKTLTRDDAIALGNAYRDALANPRWSMSDSSQD